MGNGLRRNGPVFVHHADKSRVERITRGEAYKRFTNAVRARVHGDWDCPDLVAYGPLSESSRADIEELLEFYGVA